MPASRAAHAAFVLALIAGSARTAHAQQGFGPDESPYALRLEVDIPAILAATVIWAAPTVAVGSTVPGPACGGSHQDLCDASRLNPLDRPAVGLTSPAARTVANYLSVMPIAFGVIDVLNVGPRHWRGWLPDLTVMLETLAWQGAVLEVVRRTARRPRPFLYTADVYPADRDGSEATFSFYSGHTSEVFAGAVALAYTYTLRHPESRYNYLVWPALLAVATVEPVLRVASGDHFPTDVICGALVGSAFGLMVPALHRRARSLPKVVARMQLAPVVDSGRALVTLGSQF